MEAFHIVQKRMVRSFCRRSQRPDRPVLTFMRLLEADIELFFRLCCLSINQSGVVMWSQAVIGHVGPSRRILMQRVIITGATIHSAVSKRHTKDLEVPGEVGRLD